MNRTTIGTWEIESPLDSKLHDPYNFGLNDDVASALTAMVTGCLMILLIDVVFRVVVRARGRCITSHMIGRRHLLASTLNPVSWGVLVLEALERYYRQRQARKNAINMHNGSNGGGSASARDIGSPLACLLGRRRDAAPDCSEEFDLWQCPEQHSGASSPLPTLPPRAAATNPVFKDPLLVSSSPLLGGGARLYVPAHDALQTFEQQQQQQHQQQQHLASTRAWVQQPMLMEQIIQAQHRLGRTSPHEQLVRSMYDSDPQLHEISAMGRDGPGGGESGGQRRRRRWRFLAWQHVVVVFVGLLLLATELLLMLAATKREKSLHPSMDVLPTFRIRDNQSQPHLNTNVLDTCSSYPLTTKNGFISRLSMNLCVSTTSFTVDRPATAAASPGEGGEDRGRAYTVDFWVALVDRLFIFGVTVDALSLEWMPSVMFSPGGDDTNKYHVRSSVASDDAERGLLSALRAWNFSMAVGTEAPSGSGARGWINHTMGTEGPVNGTEYGDVYWKFVGRVHTGGLATPAESHGLGEVEALAAEAAAGRSGGAAGWDDGSVAWMGRFVGVLNGVLSLDGSGRAMALDGSGRAMALNGGRGRVTEKSGGSTQQEQGAKREKVYLDEQLKKDGARAVVVYQRAWMSVGVALLLLGALAVVWVLVVGALQWTSGVDERCGWLKVFLATSELLPDAHVRPACCPDDDDEGDEEGEEVAELDKKIEMDERGRGVRLRGRWRSPGTARCYFI